jgi:hypothetical protein
MNIIQTTFYIPLSGIDVQEIQIDITFIIVNVLIFISNNNLYRLRCNSVQAVHNMNSSFHKSNIFQYLDMNKIQSIEIWRKCSNHIDYCIDSNAYDACRSKGDQDPNVVSSKINQIIYVVGIGTSVKVICILVILFLRKQQKRRINNVINHPGWNDMEVIQMDMPSMSEISM